MVTRAPTASSRPPLPLLPPVLPLYLHAPPILPPVLALRSAPPRGAPFTEAPDEPSDCPWGRRPGPRPQVTARSACAGRALLRGPAGGGHCSHHQRWQVEVACLRKGIFFLFDTEALRGGLAVPLTQPVAQRAGQE